MLERAALSFPRDLPGPGIEPVSPAYAALAGWVLTAAPLRPALRSRDAAPVTRRAAGWASASRQGLRPSPPGNAALGRASSQVYLCQHCQDWLRNKLLMEKFRSIRQF